MSIESYLRENYIKISYILRRDGTHRATVNG